jgi:hypothetical protein
MADQERISADVESAIEKNDMRYLTQKPSRFTIIDNENRSGRDKQGRLVEGTSYRWVRVDKGARAYEMKMHKYVPCNDSPDIVETPGANDPENHIIKHGTEVYQLYKRPAVYNKEHRRQIADPGAKRMEGVWSKIDDMMDPAGSGKKLSLNEKRHMSYQEESVPESEVKIPRYTRRGR